jgi:hypothetical protein
MGFFAGLKRLNVVLVLMAVTLASSVMGEDNVPTQPGGQPPTHFARTDGGEHWVRFENPEHDFPLRIEYRRDGDRLYTEVAGPGNNGVEAVIRLDYGACEDSL